MKKENIPKMKAKVLKMLPTPQTNIWKTLNIDTKSCSTLIKLMINQDLVTRRTVKGKIIVEKLDSAKHISQGNTKPKTSSKTTPTAKKENNITELSAEISKILPALQSEIWKKLGIERRQCSRLMKVLADNGLIKKTRKGGTYMVEKVIVNNNEFIKQKNFSALLSDSGRFSPCTGCVIDCNPKFCHLINNWLLDIKVR